MNKMILNEILQTKGTGVFSILADATLKEAVDQLVEHAIGSLLACHVNMHANTFVGIITERDILRCVTSRGCGFEDLYVSDAMTANLITVSPSHTVEEAMGLMTKHGIRYLPVMTAGVICGVISIGDLVKANLPG